MDESRTGHKQTWSRFPGGYERKPLTKVLNENMSGWSRR